MELQTIQKRNKLNNVHVADEKGNGNAYHIYHINQVGETNNLVGEIQFQNGARTHEESIAGILDADLLEICRHRLQSFQKGDFATRENAIALTHIEEALLWLNKRVEDRAERNVLGTDIK